MGWRISVLVVALLALGIQSDGAEDQPNVENPFKAPTPPKVDSDEGDELATVEENFYINRMSELHPVQRQIICRLAGDEKVNFSRSVLIKSLAEQFKVAPRIGVDEKKVEHAIWQLEEYWLLIRKVPGTETREDPIYELKNDAIARRGMRLWAKKICAPDNLFCVDFDAGVNK